MISTSVAPAGVPSPIEFFSHLNWIDGRPLLNTIEPYRRKIFMAVLFTFTADGRLRYTMALAGRGKKNWKTADLCLAAIYRFLVWLSPQGNDVFLVANDADQANDDLSLIKKIIAANPILDREVTVGAKSISRRDGKGTMQIVPRQRRRRPARQDLHLRGLRRDPRLQEPRPFRGIGTRSDAQ